MAAVVYERVMFRERKRMRQKIPEQETHYKESYVPLSAFFKECSSFYTSHATGGAHLTTPLSASGSCPAFRPCPSDTYTQLAGLVWEHFKQRRPGHTLIFMHTLSRKVEKLGEEQVVEKQGQTTRIQHTLSFCIHYKSFIFY